MCCNKVFIYSDESASRYADKLLSNYE